MRQNGSAAPGPRPSTEAADVAESGQTGSADADLVGAPLRSVPAGRPPKHVKRPINVRLYDEERTRVAADAEAAGMNLSDWVRYRLGVDVVLPDPLAGPMLMVPKTLLESLEGVWRDAGYNSLEDFVAEALEGAVVKELTRLADRARAAAGNGVTVLGVGSVRRFEVKTSRCHHPASAHQFRDGLRFCGLCGGRLGKA
jgi:hypothetical protein